MPSERTLRDYIDWMLAKPGFSADRHIMKEAKIAETPDYKKKKFDEIKVKRGGSLSLQVNCWICQRSLNICMNMNGIAWKKFLSEATSCYSRTYVYSQRTILWALFSIHVISMFIFVRSSTILLYSRMGLHQP